MRLPHDRIEENGPSLEGAGHEGHNVPTVIFVAQSELEGGREAFELRDAVLGQLEKDSAGFLKVGSIGHDPVG